MRVGQNPAKFVEEVPQPKDVMVALVVYLPFLDGYYAQGLDVLKLCLESIWENTQMPYDLMIFDNASCSEVRQYLLEAQEQGKIQYLMLSEQNVGKAGAWNAIFGAAPGKYIAYADSDVYHYPGWLTPQIKVLETFPKAGMVTGLPMVVPEQYSSATVTWAEESEDVTLERGQLLPWEDFWRHAGSLGSEKEKARKFYQENDALVITHQDRKYFIGASHFQFVTRKAVVERVLPIPSKRPMGQVRLLDEAINEQGYLRFCTPDWHNQHIGNTLPGPEFYVRKPPESKAQAVEGKPKRRSLWSFGPLNRIVRKVYHKSFEILYKD